MTDPNIIQQHIQRSAPPPRVLKLTHEQSALLLTLLTDNARAWNAPLRLQLHQYVTGTEAFNARVRLQEGRV